MNELIEHIFKTLNLTPDEKFYIKEKPNELFKINENLIVSSQHHGDYYFCRTDILSELLTKKYTIIKIKNPNENDLIIFKYVNLCEYNYIAMDKNERIYMYKTHPKKLLTEWGSDDTDPPIIHTPISCISWEDDQPLYIKDYI